jgi:acetyltransferase EpsM
MLYVGRTGGIKVVPLGLLDTRRQRAECDAHSVKIIGDGGHGAVVRELANAQKVYPGDDYWLIAVGDNMSRKNEVEKRRSHTYLALIHPSAIVSRSAVIGQGTVVMAGVIIQAEARIGQHCILNTGCTVDHHVVIEDYAHIAPGAHLCGNVEIGEGALVGVGVGIAPGCKIPAWSLVKARRLEIVPLSSHG